MKRFLIAVLVVAAGGLTLAGQASAGKNFKWLCKPGRADNPCLIPLKTTVVKADGSETTYSPGHSRKPPVDCFYVYPTVSGQSGANADLAEDPEVDSIAEQQAAQFTRNCRMFAPLYPQFTIDAIGAGLTSGVIDKAYGGVKSAFNEYLKKYNHGRGFVLIGHSQGAGHLSRLIEEKIDRRSGLRKRLVSSVLLGGNVWVPKGKRVGGQFKKVPACSRAKELGCVIASSGFLTDPPPSDSLFGRLTGALVTPGLDPEKYEVMCVNPARLDGSKGLLKPLYNTEPFAGLYGPLLPNLSRYETGWASFPGLYSASCERTGDGAHFLQVKDISTAADQRPRIGEPLGRTWGTHLTEVNDQAGNLVRVVRAQSFAYRKKVRLAKKRLRLDKKKSQRKPK